ncbi:protocadherin-20 [Trichomycterus rosablanca]|uniref:protocadherin-20 n=1 Tax=Trichomycterus rosablanca TaxID=2290929 RepID=UPI002F353942
MNLASLLQVLLVAFVRQIVCQLPSPFSTPEEQTDGIKIGALGGAYPPPYLLLGSVYLRVDEETGDVYTTEQKMDREALCPSQDGGYCTITADALVGPEQDMVKITVIVEDINDKAPHFETNEIRLKIPESAVVGTRVLLEEKAWDEDIGSNAEIRYHLEGAGGFFSVAQDGDDLELVVERGLDRETQDEHRMLLVAVDGGRAALSGTASLIITVLDVDDNCPQFSPENPKNVTVPAGATKDTPVAHVMTVDPDLATNSQITYSFSPLISDRAKELFYLDQATGWISLDMDVRLYSLEEHILKVVMTSTSCPTEQTQLTVYLLPLELQKPSIEIKFLAEFKNQTILIRENEPPTVLAILTPRDTSSPPGVQKVLYLENKSTAFILKAQADSYLLSTSKPLDFELCSDYQISVVISDPGRKHVLGSEVIKVAVQDVNDNVPRFEKQNYQVEIEENNEPGVSLIQVRASDADSQLDGKVAYLLIYSMPAFFSVNKETGVLSVLESLDREQQGAYTLTVLARDHGSPPLEALAYVSIKVLDQNDNSPTFVPPRFIFFISESILKLAHVGKIGVFDADEGENGTVVDVQVVNQDVPFAVDFTHMVLRCTAEVDREKQDRYELLLQAIDGGNPRRSSSASVTVFIEDVNDNQPEVILPNSNFSCLTVPPSTKAGSIITKIYAIDHDSGVNSDITYHMMPSQPAQSSPFRIDPRSGNITLVQPLVIGDYGMHHLYIRVSDGGKPVPLQTAVWINVLVNETSEECHLTSVPQYLDSQPHPTPTTAEFKPSTSCTDQSWFILLCGLGMMAFSVFTLLASAVVCLRHRNMMRRRQTEKEQDYITEMDPLKDRK